MICFTNLKKDSLYIDFDSALKSAPREIKDILINARNKCDKNMPINIKKENLFSLNRYKKYYTSCTTSLCNVKSLANFFNTMLNRKKDKFDVRIGDYGFEFSASNDPKINGISSNKTAMQEIGVLLYLDNNLKDLTNYKKSNKLKVFDDKLICDTIKFLQLDKSWNESCLSSARIIAKIFPNYKDYEFHRDTPEFRQIKEKGKLLSGLHPDKWNAADIFLIKNTSDVLHNINKFVNFSDLNNYMRHNENIISISLKKSEKNAMHGSVALNELARILKISWCAKTPSNMDEAIKSMYDDLCTIKQSPISDYVVIKDFKNNNLKDCLYSIGNSRILSPNFLKSLPACISFIADNCSNVDKFFEIIKFAYITAMSNNSLSAPYYSVEGSVIEFIDNKNQFKFDIDKIIIPLNGDTNVIFALKVNDSIVKLQARSKGSLPQFIVIKTDPTKNLKAINIKNFN